MNQEISVIRFDYDCKNGMMKNMEKKMTPLLYSIHYALLGNMDMLMASNFSADLWQNNLYTSSFDPIRSSRSLRKIFIDHTLMAKEEYEYSDDYAFFLDEDYHKIVSLLTRLSDESNWDINRKMFIADKNISSECMDCIFILNEYKKYFNPK